MNKIIYKIFPVSVFAILILIALISGCSKQADNLVVVPSETESCTTCHGNAEHIYPPRSLAGHTLPTEQGVGAHVVHLSPDSSIRYSAAVECIECHLPVASYYDTNHLNASGRANVVFGTLSKTKTTGYTPNPIWNSTNQTCSNLYCHGYFKGGNPTATATFNNPNSIKCGSCHGNETTGNPKPVSTHQYYPDQCWYCHGAVVDANNTIINKYKHVNGVIDFNVAE
jgi:predicted CxxxxCH...CXXCH cytochrome family protein